MRPRSLRYAVALVACLAGCASEPGWSEPARTASTAYRSLDPATVAERIAAGDGSAEAAESLRLQGPKGLAAVLGDGTEQAQRYRKYGLGKD